MNLQESIRIILREELNKPKSNSNDTFQYLIDMEMQQMKELCYEQGIEEYKELFDMVSFNACDFLEYTKPEVEVIGIDKHNNNLVIIVKIRVSTRQWRIKDEESFVGELERRLKMWIGDNIIEVNVISYI